MGEQVFHHAAGLGIRHARMGSLLCLQRFDCLPNDGINRFGEGSRRPIDGHIEQTRRCLTRLYPPIRPRLRHCRYGCASTAITQEPKTLPSSSYSWFGTGRRRSWQPRRPARSPTSTVSPCSLRPWMALFRCSCRNTSVRHRSTATSSGLRTSKASAPMSLESCRAPWSTGWLRQRAPSHLADVLAATTKRQERHANGSGLARLYRRSVARFHA